MIFRTNFIICIYRMASSIKFENQHNKDESKKAKKTRPTSETGTRLVFQDFGQKIQVVKGG